MGKANKRQDNVMYSGKLKKAGVVKHAFDQASSNQQRRKDSRSSFAPKRIDSGCKEQMNWFSLSCDCRYSCQGTGWNTRYSHEFFMVVYTGSVVVKDTNKRVQRYIEAAAKDCLFIGSRAIIKPSKHVCLRPGLKQKSYRDSKPVWTLFKLAHSRSSRNGFGHVCNLRKTLLHQTAFFNSQDVELGLLGTIMMKMLKHCLVAALHGIVGICYPNISAVDSALNADQEIQVPWQSRKRKRAFHQ